MILEEGLSKIKIPESDVSRGPGTKRPGFYNPDQVLNRDITIALISALKPRRYLDGFGGTGIRGIRVSLETEAEASVAEINTRSVEIIKENVELNGVSLEVHSHPFESVVSDSTYGFIDVDPYGSIVPFLDVAITHVRNGGYLGLTATDLSALTGSSPGKTRRRYDAYVETDRLKHETGIRLLLAYVARRAAALNREMIPIISFWRSHYYRIVVQIRNGAAGADRALEQIRTIDKSSDLSGIYGSIIEGPIWTGALSDTKIVDKCTGSKLESVSEASYSLLQSLPNEDERLYFFELADFGRYLKRSLPTMDHIMGALEKETGMPSHRTHFSQTGIKSAISGEEFQSIFDRITS